MSMLRAVCNIFTGEISGRSLFYDSTGFCLSGLPRATLRITRVVLPLIIVRHVRCSAARQQFEWLRARDTKPVDQVVAADHFNARSCRPYPHCVDISNATHPQFPRPTIARQIFAVNWV